MNTGLLCMSSCRRAAWRTISSKDYTAKLSDYTAKLSDFGLDLINSCAAREKMMTGHLTKKSDTYSFGVILLELLTGRMSARGQNLVDWAWPRLSNPKNLGGFIDPALNGNYSSCGAEKAAAVAYRCLTQSPEGRPQMREVLEALEPLLDMKDIPLTTLVHTVEQPHVKKKDKAPEVKKERKYTGKNGHRRRVIRDRR